MCVQAYVEEVVSSWNLPVRSHTLYQIYSCGFLDNTRQYLERVEDVSIEELMD